MTRAILFANGDLPDPGPARLLIQPDDALIAADGGARHAIKLGVIPSVIIGDLDSLSVAEVRVFEDMGIHILKYPPNKDETDLELALRHALQSGHNPITILGGLGGRLDQTIGILSLIASPECIAANVRMDDGITEVFFINRQATIYGQVGEIVSLQPWGVPAEGVSTDNLVYPLHHETLLPHQTRGISNQMLAGQAEIELERGTLLCIHTRKR
jgi:thiamine pyrophosphokinase